MPDKNAKSTGLRALINRSKRTSTTAQDAISPEASPVTQTLPDAASSQRPIFRPRHAGRDMLLSTPVPQRADLAAKVFETKRKDVCSEIGFNTGPLPSSSGRTRSQPLFVHPKLNRQQLAHIDIDSPLSVSGSRPVSSGGRLAGPSRTASSPTASLHQGYGAPGDNNNADSIDDAGLPGKHSGVDAVDHALRALNLEEANRRLAAASGRPPVLASESSTSADQPSLAATASNAPRRSYFSHNSIPNLRAVQGKGKGKATEGHVYYNSSVPMPQAENKDSYIIRTQRPSRTAASVPPRSDDSFTDSMESRESTQAFNTWSLPASPSQQSLRTMRTEYTEQGDQAVEKEDEDDRADDGEAEIKEAQAVRVNRASMISDAGVSDWHGTESDH